MFFYFYKIKRGGASPFPTPTPEKFYLKKKVIMCASWRVNGIASELPVQRIGTFIVLFWQWKWMSMFIRLKVPIEMHYTVISMGTSKVNSSQCFLLCLRDTWTKLVPIGNTEARNGYYVTDRSRGSKMIPRELVDEDVTSGAHSKSAAPRCHHTSVA